MNHFDGGAADEQAEYAAAARKDEPKWTDLFGMAPDFDNDPDDTEGHKRMAELEAEVARLTKVLEGVRALADEWDADNGIISPDSRYTHQVMKDELRARLDAEADPC